MTKNPIALITGIRGQDSAWLAKLLLEKNYTVIGTDRRSGGATNWRLAELGIHNHPNLIYEYMDITEPENVNKIIKKYQPDELYQLAAQSFVTTSFDQPYVTNNINYYGHLNILEAVRHYSFPTKIYFAGSSEQYGKVKTVIQNESTPFYPRSPYGVSKVASYYLGVNYRESYGMFITNGILFNHESSLRGNEFVTQKIIKKLCELKHAIINSKSDSYKPLVLGNIYSQRDFSHAQDMVYGMWLMLQMNTPDDYVLSSDSTITIKTFINKVCEQLNIEVKCHNEGQGIKEYSTWKDKIIIQISEEFYRPAEVDLLLGDSTKAREILRWKPSYNIDGLIKEMIDKEFKRGI